MDTLKDIGAIIGLILSVITLITLCTKAGRAFIKSLFKKETKDIVDENAEQTKDIKEIKATLETLVTKTDGLQEMLLQQCRDTIKNIYYKYQHNKRIPLYERKTADKVWAIYNGKFEQNTYAKLLYGEICKWEIDTVSYQDIAED